MYTDNWTELYHHGIKGQKHGQRRYQNPDGSLTPLGREHYGVGIRRAKKVAGAGTAVAGVGLVNAGLLAAKRASTANAAKYYSKATTQAEFASSWKNAGLSFARQEAKNYTEQLLALPALTSPAVVAPIAIGGAAVLAGLGYIGYKKYQQYKANKGTSVKHCDLSEFDEDTLCHFGIPGQKWGKRRYQNPDGSLTPEGYIHYGYKKRDGSVSDKGQKQNLDSVKKTYKYVYGHPYSVSDECKKNIQNAIDNGITDNHKKQLKDANDKFSNEFRETPDFYDSKESKEAHSRAYKNTIEYFKKEDPGYLEDIIKRNDGSTSNLDVFHDFRKTYEGFDDEEISKAEEDWNSKHKNYVNDAKKNDELFDNIRKTQKSIIKDIFGSNANKRLRPLDKYSPTYTDIINWNVNWDKHSK